MGAIMTHMLELDSIQLEMNELFADVTANGFADIDDPLWLPPVEKLRDLHRLITKLADIIKSQILHSPASYISERLTFFNEMSIMNQRLWLSSHTDAQRCAIMDLMPESIVDTIHEFVCAADLAPVADDDDSAEASDCILPHLGPDLVITIAGWMLPRMIDEDFIEQMESVALAASTAPIDDNTDNLFPFRVNMTPFTSYGESIWTRQYYLAPDPFESRDVTLMRDTHHGYGSSALFELGAFTRMSEFESEAIRMRDQRTAARVGTRGSRSVRESESSVLPVRDMRSVRSVRSIRSDSRAQHRRTNNQSRHR